LNTLVNFESAQPSQSDQFSVGVNNLALFGEKLPSNKAFFHVSEKYPFT
jgi:hypothetical protein